VLLLYDEIQYPKQDSVYTASLKYLAFVVKLKNEPDSAIRLIEQAIALEEGIWPEANNLKLAESYYILGTIYKDQKEYEKSIAQISKSLAICQSVMGEYYPGTLANFNLLATLHNQAGQHDRALQYALRTPAIAVKLFGEWHSETGTTMANLGKLLLDLDQYDSAYKYLSRAHQIREKIFSGKPHVHTMISLNNLINLFHLTGQIDSASLYLEKGLTMSRSERIQDRQRVVTYRLAGEIFKSRGQYDSALRYYQQSLTLSQDNMIQDDDPRLTYLRSKIQETDSLRSTAIAP
jgi:tetratricopeptide (TPR) repeat protein